MVESFDIDGAVLFWILEKSLYFGSEYQLAVVDAVVQRLYPDPVANQPKLPFASVPQAESEHAAEPLHTVDPPLRERMQYYFGIRVISFPPVPTFSLQFGPNFRVIVDFTVEHYTKRAIFVTHWLASGGR